MSQQKLAHVLLSQIAVSLLRPSRLIYAHICCEKRYFTCPKSTQLIAGGVLTGTYPADLKLVYVSTWLCMHQQQCQHAQWVLLHKQPVLNAVLCLSFGCQKSSEAVP